MCGWDIRLYHAIDEAFFFLIFKFLMKVLVLFDLKIFGYLRQKLSHSPHTDMHLCLCVCPPLVIVEFEMVWILEE